MVRNYERRTPRSRKLFERAKRVFAGGVNHNARYYEPYPLSVSKAKGQHVWDEDGNRYVDYWMGHTALILGHSPPVVIRALRDQVPDGTHFGLSNRFSVELAEEVQRAVPCAELLRFCNSGAEATMYLVRLARAYTRKRIIIKMAGGWHGYNTDLNIGVHGEFDRTEGEGILKEEQAHVRMVRFNDLEAAQAAVSSAKGDVAAILLEPVLGAGGCIPADRKYLEGLRELASKEGALMAFDEIITGFRIALGGAQERYGVDPDIAAFGKIVGGGLPIGLVCGRREILSMADPKRRKGFVSIGGGTFSENPLVMVAGLATITYLRRNRNEVYSRLERLGNRLRERVDEAFAECGVSAKTTGIGSLFLTHFGSPPRSAEESAKDDKRLESRYATHLMTERSFILPGHLGAISTVHLEADINELIASSKRFGIGASGRVKKVRGKVTS